MQAREPSTLQILTSQTLAPLPLGTQSMADTGHAIFHANSGADLACASCHPEGGDDGRVWLFSPKPALPAEPRRTQNLRGGISVTAPFHWEGDLKDIDALMHEVFVSRMQGPELTAAELKSVRTWLDGVPLLPRRPVTDAAAVGRGRALFNETSVACATCHAGLGDTLTNNTTHDVGTGKPFQVPSLRGLHYRAPYMHDGCAATVADRFRSPCGGGDRHGVTSRLTSEQIVDMTAYLESL
ncbi:MAG TPA: c-type cytochrome [Polyangia bacterium]|nr:c-type cytochrome [Polyangia bacterium]